MAASSSASSRYPSSSSSSSSNFNDLPVMAMKKKIVEKIQENRVTLIVGEAGCGKSSQVPQFLLDNNIEPILCTQPRRFAVVAVARMVAKARKCEVGEEVGYHIGHSKVFSERSKIIFKTAGVLLEEMRDKGVNALNYKVVILDEVHERSVESDLALVCVKQFLLKKKDLRLVLMSATADIARYREYFRDLGKDERVEVLAIPSTGQHTVFQRKVLYLEQVTDLLGINSDELSLKYCSGPSPFTADATIKPEVHKLIHDLVIHIHNYEPDIEKSILVFLPTYYSLEQQWFLLKPFSNCFKVHILHSSIDTEEALKAMKIWKSHRKVILATNIAESSVTIPKVGYVIDSCRSLQVVWDSNRKADSAKLDWLSKSQAEQRKGRTGRTCDGDVYRLVTGSFFSQLQEYEPPSILNLSLRQQVLLICCAESKAINDPKILLQKALDPPDREVIQDALDLLVRIGALEITSPRGRYQPTFYGRLLASFSLSLDASVLILKFGDIGMLREGILLGLMMDIQTLPILRPFGQESLFFEYINNYYCGDGLTGKKELVYMANVCAFNFWQHVLKDKYRLERLKKLLKFNKDTWHPKIEEDWCSFHNLAQSALQQVAEMYDEILSSLHRFRPKFLVTSYGLPSDDDAFEFWHTCFVDCEQNGYIATLEADDEHLEHDREKNKCVAVPFLAPHHFQANEVAETFAAVVKEMRVQYAENISENFPKNVNNNGGDAAEEAPLCKYFARGLCNRGSQCLFSHSSTTRTPVCKFFFSLQGCHRGDSCLFSHDLGPLDSTVSGPNLCCPEDENADAMPFVYLLPPSSEGCVLLLDDTDLHFASLLSNQYNSSSIIVTTSLQDQESGPLLPDAVRIMWGLSHPSQTIISRAGKSQVPWSDVQCVLWFPNFDNEKWEVHKGLIQTFFDYLAIRILADSLVDVQVVLTMNNIRFSQLQVEKLARESFFFLQHSCLYDESLGRLSDGVPTKKPMVVSKPISYVFNLCPPTNIPIDDCATVLSHYLHKLEHAG